MTCGQRSHHQWHTSRSYREPKPTLYSPILPLLHLTSTQPPPTSSTVSPKVPPSSSPYCQSGPRVTNTPTTAKFRGCPGMTETESVAIPVPLHAPQVKLPRVSSR